MSAVVVGTGHDLPEWTLTNDELEAMGVGFDRQRAGGLSLDAWVKERVGVHSRHRVRPGEGTSDMGTRAALRALEDGGLEPEAIDLIVLSTFSSDYRSPSTAALVQKNLGVSCKFFQLDAACAGFVDAVIAAGSLLELLQEDTALVISTDAVSQFCKPDDFKAQSVFGDGAGAAILRRRPGSPFGVKAHYTGGDGSKGKLTWIPGGGTKEPMSESVLRENRQYAVWAHKEVYTFAVRKLVESAQIVAERAGWDLDDVAWFIPHQAGRNIILDAARFLEQPEEKFVFVIDHTGNTSGSTIPIALDEANRAGKLKEGDKLILPAIGAGMAWGALAVVWHDYRGNGKG